MKKTLPFLLAIIFFSNVNTVNAQSSWFESILSFFTGRTSSYISKDNAIDLNSNNSDFTTYSSSNSHDYTTRAISDSSRLVNRGQHIEDIILNKYSSPSDTIDERDDKILALNCDGQCQNTTYSGQNCRPIRTSEIAYFFLTQNSSTSYKLENNRAITIPFSSEIRSKLINTYENKISLAPQDCYRKLYEQISITPKSNDADQSPKNTTSSQQLTNVEKTILPDKDGSKEVPLTWFESVTNFFDGGNTEKVKENYYRENQYLNSFAPEKQKTSLNIDTVNDNDSLRSNFASLLKPDKWNDGVYDTGEGSGNFNGTYNNVDLATFIDGVEHYIFENPGGGRITSVYDLGVKDKSKLVVAPAELQAPNYSEKVDSRIIPAYLAMIRAARASGIADSQLRLISGYRTFAQQLALWNSYPANERCNGINKPCYVADPYKASNHYTGRAIDIVVTGAGKAKNMTPAYRWLLDNANKFGFYNYDPEPWHWEYNPKSP